MKKQEDTVKGQKACAPTSSALHGLAALRWSWTSRVLSFIKFCQEPFCFNLMTQMFNYPGTKLDCTCIAERIFLTVKSDPVCSAHCDTGRAIQLTGQTWHYEEISLALKSCLPLHLTDSPNKGVI